MTICTCRVPSKVCLCEISTTLRPLPLPPFHGVRPNLDQQWRKEERGKKPNHSHFLHACTKRGGDLLHLLVGKKNESKAFLVQNSIFFGLPCPHIFLKKTASSERLLQLSHPSCGVFLLPKHPSSNWQTPFFIKKTSNNDYTATKGRKKRRGKTTKLLFFFLAPLWGPPFLLFPAPIFSRKKTAAEKKLFFFPTIPFVPNPRSLPSPPVHDLFNYQLVTGVIFRTPPPPPPPMSELFWRGTPPSLSPSFLSW